MPLSHQAASRGSERPPIRWRTECARWALLLGASLVALTSSAAAQSGLDELDTAIARLAEKVLPSVVRSRAADSCRRLTRAATPPFRFRRPGARASSWTLTD